MDGGLNVREDELEQKKRRMAEWMDRCLHGFVKVSLN